MVDLGITYYLEKYIVTYTSDFEIKEYNADEGCYQFHSKMMGDYDIPVERESARNFKDNYSINVYGSQWGIKNNEPYIVKLRVDYDNKQYYSK